jgi:RNA-binding protein YlmH
MIKVNVDSVRLDRFVGNVLGRSWGASQKLVRNGFIRIGGKKTKDYTLKLQRGDEIEIRCFTPAPP